jgi:hypothetical protein
MKNLKHIPVTHMTKESSENDSGNSSSTMTDLTWPEPVKIIAITILQSQIADKLNGSEKCAEFTKCDQT